MQTLPNSGPAPAPPSTPSNGNGNGGGGAGETDPLSAHVKQLVDDAIADKNGKPPLAGEKVAEAPACLPFQASEMVGGRREEN